MGSEFGFDEWMFETRAVRDSLAALGVLVPECLPGEGEDCGTSVESHYRVYLAMLHARVMVMATANIPQEEDDDFQNQTLYYMNIYGQDAPEGP